MKWFQDRGVKLKIEDVVVAVDGTEFRSTSENLVDLTRTTYF